MIELPPTFQDLLKKNLELDGAVKLAISKYAEVLRWSTLPFFPEYTDHGPRHVSEVLQTFTDLITPESWNLLTPQDATASILSALFHDLGMHIAEDGFFALTDPHNTEILIPEIDTEAWPNLWEDFVAEARRFDQKQLMKIFGDTLPVSFPPRERDLLTGRDRKLIGEFIRRHHPRLGHEFALFGFQGATKRVNAISEVPHDLLDISGLIARSHGSNLREFFPYLKKQYSCQEYNRIHPPFLMALLRVSDYLQIQATRAPNVRLELQEIRSPFSLREWRTHGAVVDVSKYHDDPESIYLRTHAPSPEVYLNLKNLTLSLQNELDSCWAVLGEVYGRFPPLNKLGLTLRRVRSDLDEAAKVVPGEFVRDRFSFEAAGAELLKLLATPLYGNNPNSAVRELIQNAADAVLEMEAIVQRTGRASPTLEQEADILISLDGNDTNGYTLRIADKGVGMNSHILKNYFLRAGASYRRSAEWQKNFADASGHSTVLRSGRFGIGVLAAFVLGPQVEVRTRHYSEQYGLSFSARLETDPIDLRYCEMRVGTEIRITVANSKVPYLKRMFDSKLGRELGHNSLPAGLYLVPHPSLALMLNGQRVERGELWPACGQDPLPLGWNRIRPSGFREVQWQYRPDALTRFRVEPTACNGIAVSPGTGAASFYKLRHVLQDGELYVSRPKLSVFDPDGNLPLTLDRTLETPRMPFEKELVRDIYRDIAAYCLAAFASEGETKPPIRDTWPLFHSAFQHSAQPYLFLFLESGFTVLDAKLAASQNFHTINIFRFLPRGFTLPSPCSGEGSIVQGTSKRSARARDKVVREVVTAVRRREKLYGYKVVGARLLCTESLWRDCRKRVANHFLRHLSEEAEADRCLSLTVGKCLPPSISISIFAAAASLSFWAVEMMITQFYVVKDTTEPPDSLISTAFYEDIGSTFIPYDLNERKMLPGYNNLRRQIEFHELRLRARAEEKARSKKTPPPTSGT